MCKVSILTPVYNVEKYLRQCLESLVKQTLTDVEFICINDGSKDKSFEILKEYATIDARFKIIDKQNSGYGDSMNAGLRVASGEYIGIVESDDFAEADMFEKLYEAAVNNDAEVVRSNFLNYWENIEEKEELLKGEIYNTVFSPEKEKNRLFAFTPYIWSSIYKREFLLKNDIWFNPTPGASYQDFSFNAKVLACAQRVYLLEDAFLHYRRDNEASSVNSKGKVYCMFDEYAETKKYLMEKGKLHGINGYWLAYKIYSTGLGNCSRVAFEYKSLFWEKLMDEFVWCEQEELFKREFFSYEQWSEITNILKNGNSEFVKRYAGWQKEKAVREYFDREINNKICYVYGAGKIGSEIVKLLLKRGTMPDGVVVSNKENNPGNIYGIRVYSIDEIKPPCDDMVFLLALKEEWQYEVLTDLSKRNYKNMIAVDRDIRNVLR